MEQLFIQPRNRKVIIKRGGQNILICQLSLDLLRKMML
jgi:hypothetical protein